MSKLLLVASLTAGGLLLFAQTKFQITPALVPVHTIVTAEARHGKEIPSLKREDVMAFEGHDLLPVTDLVPFQGENAGLELFILVDEASSSRFGSHLDDLRRFIERQPETTLIGVAYMRNGMVDIAQGLTTDHGAAARSLRLPLSYSGMMASPYLSLEDLITRWPANVPRREVVMLTSGDDPLGGPRNAYLDSAIEDAQCNGVIVYGIYVPAAGHAGHAFWRLNWAQNNLAQLSEESGGEAYMLGFGAPVSLAPYLAEINTHLAHQYQVSFLMKPEKKAALRPVRLVTAAPNVDLVAATRVYVPINPEEPGN